MIKKTDTVGNYRVQLNLHDRGDSRFFTASVGSEKYLWIWCKTDKTEGFILSRQVGEYEKAAAFTKTGWSHLQTHRTNLTTIPAEFIKVQFHKVNSAIVFTGVWNSTITFDSCATTVHISPNEHFNDRFKGREPQFDSSAIPFFKQFIPTADNTGDYFDVNLFNDNCIFI